MRYADIVAVQPARESPEAVLARAYETRRRELVELCRPIVGDDAEDVAQDAYLRARSRIGQLRDLDRLNGWLAKIALNLCFQHHRRRQALSRLLPRLNADPTAVNRDLREAIEHLPTRHRTVVVLFYAHGLDVAEIARLLDQKPVSVRTLLHRARKQLRVALEVGGP